MMVTEEEYKQRMRDEQEIRDEEAAIHEERISEYQHNIEIWQYVRALTPTPSDVILDAGGGTGRVARVLATVAGKVVIADLSFNSLLIAKQRSEKAHIRVDCVQCDLAHLPFAAKTFHKVLSAGVLEHVPGRANRQAIVSSFFHSLVPGGRIVFSVYNYHIKHRLLRKCDVPHGRNYDHYFSISELRDEIREIRSKYDVRYRSLRIFPVLNLVHLGIGARLGRLGKALDQWLSNFPWVGWVVGSFLVCNIEADLPK